MKNNRTSPSKLTVRLPEGGLSTDHLSALAAFEQWQRESPRIGAVRSSDDAAANDSATDRKMNN